MKKFILASQSPRRRQILEDIGLKHEVIPSDAEENISVDLEPERYVMELALLKGTQVAKNMEKDCVVISADTIVLSDGRILGKPSSPEDAESMLMSLSGKWHSVLTGYCVIDCADGNMSVKYEQTNVKFRTLDKDEICRYIKSGECMDKAGAYGIQEKGRLFVEKIDGDFFNVVGLPICALAKMLKQDFGIEIM